MSDTHERNDEASKKPKKSRWGKILLTLSLALNLLFVGAIVGGGWMRHKFHAGDAGPSSFVIKRLLHHLPEDKRQKILDQIAVHRTAMGSKVKAIKTRQKGLKSALRNEPFNASDVHTAALELKKTRRDIIDAKTDILVNVLAQLTPDERREILESRFFRHLFSQRGRWSGRRHYGN